MVDYLAHLGSKELMLLANDLRKDYNKACEHLKKKVEYYSRQSIASTYHKEEDIQASLDRCRELKRQYMDLRDALLERGLKPDIGGWRESNNTLYAEKDILHSA